MKLDQHYRILYWHNPRGYLDTTLRVLQICILYREVSMIELNFHAKIFSLDGIISYYITVKDVTCRERLLRNRNGISWNHRHRHYCRIRRRNNKWNNVYGDRHNKYLEWTPYYFSQVGLSKQSLKSRLEQLDSANKYAYIYAVGTDILFTADDADAKSADLIVKHLSDYGLWYLCISFIFRSLPGQQTFFLNWITFCRRRQTLRTLKELAGTEPSAPTARPPAVARFARSSFKHLRKIAKTFPKTFLPYKSAIWLVDYAYMIIISRSWGSRDIRADKQTQVENLLCRFGCSN